MMNRFASRFTAQNTNTFLRILSQSQAHLERQSRFAVFTQTRTYASDKKRRQELHPLTAKLTSTPSRLFKLVLPVPAISEDGKPSDENINNDEYNNDYPPPSSLDRNKSPTDQHPRHLALLIHPHQPLSHLAHLIQSQLPTLKSGRVPSVSFYRPVDTPPPREEVIVPEGDEVVRSGGKGGGLESPPKSAQGMSEDEESLVLWSGSTEIGDFVRDAAAGHDEEAAGMEGGFVIDIEGTLDKSGVWVSVPSFNDRSRYLRDRYNIVSNEIEEQLKIKEKCDALAHRSAQRVAMAGFGGLIGWWGLVYVLTFETRLGWDVMEPVTYLAGLSTIIIGYLWFLYNNREVSYRSVLHATISRRQLALYEQQGFDLDRWQDLLDEGREIRREIQTIANEYGVRWTGKKEQEQHGYLTKKDKEMKGKVEKVLEKAEKEKTKEDENKKKDEDEDEDDADEGETRKDKSSERKNR